MRLRLSELPESGNKTRNIRAKGLKNDYEEVDIILHHQRLSFVPETIQTELISQHHNDPLAEHFGINKTNDLVGRKYYWLSLRKDIKAYVKGYDICLGLKTVNYKLFRALQSWLVPTYQWKVLSMDFVTGLPISTDWKRESYDSILVIVDWLTKMVHYELVKVTIDAPGLAEVFLDVVIWHHGLSNSILSNRSSFFTSKFWSSLCYFLGIKRRLSTAFHLQTDGQTKHQNSTMEAYL